jgi:uncharacterized protein (TIGR02246 family)
MTSFDTLDVATDELAVHDLLARMVVAWDAGDAISFAGLYGEQASVAIAGSYLQGRNEILAFMSGGFAGPLKGTKSDERPQRIRFVAPDVAIVNSLSGIVQPGETVVRPEFQRHATWVVKRVDGSWLAEAYHNCSVERG